MISQDEIVRTVRTLITNMGYSCDDIELREDPLMKTLVVNVRSGDARRLIGRGGDVLKAITLVVRTLLEKRLEGEQELPTFTLDIDSYISKHTEQLKSHTRMIADRVRSFKSDVDMEPMSSYDRLVVHTFLAHSPNIKTESHGEGENRYVKVKYRENGVE